MTNIKVSYLLTCYNHEKYIEKALESAFNQSYENIEFIISDDCSNDKSFEIIKRISDKYKKRNILIRKNIKNIGIGSHMNDIISISSGDLIIMAAGDDISELNRVSVLVDKWLLYDKPKIISSSLIEIDKEGTLISTNISKRFNKSEDVILNQDHVNHYLSGSLLACAGATMAYSRDVIDLFGSFNPKVNSEDVVYFFRGLISGKILLISEPLVRYRRTEMSFSAPIVSKINIFSSPVINYSSDFNMLRLKQHKDDLLKLPMVTQQWLFCLEHLIEKEKKIKEIESSTYLGRLMLSHKYYKDGSFSIKYHIKNILPRYILKIIFNIKYNIKNL
ncbi:glycosyltransferase [Photobacterium leiognathi]|uniref:glycosyltransferase n=1 Tax=Photobacterium leiognathi TaxID=553611 RepID=UPI003AF36BC9